MEREKEIMCTGKKSEINNGKRKRENVGTQRGDENR